MLQDVSSQKAPFSLKVNSFLNVLTLENSKFWKNKTWLIHLFIWIILTNGIILYLYISGLSDIIAESMRLGFATELAKFSNDIKTQNDFLIGLNIFFNLNLLIIPLGIIVLLQNTIISEVENGSLVWLISNPVSRQEIILAKFSSTFLNLAIFSTLVPGTLLLIVIFLKTGLIVPVELFLGTIILNMILIAYYTSFLLLLGVVFDSRAIVLVISFSLTQIGGLVNFIQPLYEIVANLTPITFGSQNLLLILNGNITDFNPIVSTIILSVMFLGFAIWIFDRKEF